MQITQRTDYKKEAEIKKQLELRKSLTESLNKKEVKEQRAREQRNAYAFSR